jgi:hypothetical protein
MKNNGNSSKPPKTDINKVARKKIFMNSAASLVEGGILDKKVVRWKQQKYLTSLEMHSVKLVGGCGKDFSTLKSIDYKSL